MEATATAQRPWVAAGIALTTAGMVAVAPVAAPTLPEVAFPDIQLTAGLVQNTADNITDLVTYFALGGFDAPGMSVVGAPFPILQQVIANQIGYVGQVLQDPANIVNVFGSMFDNLGKGLVAPFGAFADNLFTGGGLNLDLLNIPLVDYSRLEVFNLFSGVLNGGLFNFTGSPVSGLLLGVLGPVLGPLVALGDDLGTVFGGGSNAVSTLLGIPEHMLDAFLNGGEALDVTNLLGVFGLDSSIGIPGLATLDIGETGLALGGLLGGPGSLFNALTSTVDVTALGYHVAGVDFIGDGAGPLGSLLSIPNSIAAAIGTGGLAGLQDGLLSTFANGIGLPDLATGLGDIQSFLTADILGPLTDALKFLPDQLSGLISGVLGSDLGIDALTQMVLNIPALLLTMLI